MPPAIGEREGLAELIVGGEASRGYLDGVAASFVVEAGSSIAAAGNIDTGRPAIIGQDPSGRYAESGSADMDDLGVWRRALTALEIGSIYTAGASNHLSFTGPP